MAQNKIDIANEKAALQIASLLYERIDDWFQYDPGCYSYQVNEVMFKDIVAEIALRVIESIK